MSCASIWALACPDKVAANLLPISDCRGVALEGMQRWEEAIADYKAVLAASPNDPSAWNNLGNPNAALGNWEVTFQLPRLHAHHASTYADFFKFREVECAPCRH